MDNRILLAVCVAGFAANGFLTRLFQVKFKNSVIGLPLYQACFCLFAAAMFAFSGLELPKPVTLIYGIAFGVLFFAAVHFGAKGYETGSMALTATITDMSLIIPVVYSALALGENITLPRVIGIAMFVPVFALSSCSDKSTNGGKRISVVWIVSVLACFAANGMTAVIQKNYRIAYADGQNSMFMAAAYLCAGILFLIRYLSLSRGKPKDLCLPSIPALLGVSALSGAGSFGGNLILSYLSDKLDAAILYPCVNSGLCILLGCLSFVFFREKVTAAKLTAFLLGIAAIVILNL